MAGRKPLDIDLTLLQKIISEVETGDDKPDTRAKLWKAVAERYPLKVSAQTLMMKAEKNNLAVSTPKGARGYKLKEARAKATKDRRPRKFLKNAEPEVKERFSQLGTNLVDKLLAGNLKAAVKSFCWDCCGGSKKEVSLCTAYSCPLWPHRPWQRQPEETRRSHPLQTVADTPSEKLEPVESELSSGVDDKANSEKDQSS